jgi:hypothetical protein
VQYIPARTGDKLTKVTGDKPGGASQIINLNAGQIIIIIINIFIIILKPTFKHSSNGVVVTMTIFIIHDN